MDTEEFNQFLIKKGFVPNKMEDLIGPLADADKQKISIGKLIKIEKDNLSSV